MIFQSVAFEVLVVLLLIVTNAVFAMSEIAVVSARQARLRGRADAGDGAARRALELAQHPNRFLATVQIGITLVGVLAGAYGGANIARRLDARLAQHSIMEPYSEQIALAVVVLAIVYLTLVLGELVPKRIALTDPERIASRVAGPMHVLSIAAAPVVKILSISTDFALRALKIRRSDEPPVSEEEIAAMLRQGIEAGVFEEAEHDLVQRVFWLGDQRIGSLMTHRQNIAWLDVSDPPGAHRQELIRHRHTRFLVCDGDLDTVLGMVHVQDFLAEILAGSAPDLRRLLRKPLFVPSSLRALRLLELFRESGVHLAVVMDDDGRVEGLVTLGDVLEELAGDMLVPVGPAIVQRDDGSWLVDGALEIGKFREGLQLAAWPDDHRAPYRTLAGLVVTSLGRIPAAGDAFQSGGLRFEVMDMDGYRVDKVLVSRVQPDERPPAHPP
jgi:putative hemolysin